MYFILKNASFPTTIGTITVQEGQIGGGSGGSSTPTNVTFTINPTPSNATVTLTASGYTQSGNSITVLSGTKVSYTVSASGYTSKSGSKTVSYTQSLGVTLSAEGSTPVNPPSDSTTFPLVPYGLGVTSNGTGRISSSSTRLCNGSTTEKVGILVPAGNTITLYGLASGTYPLRFDYVYGTVNAVNPPDGSSTPIEGLLGTASNYKSSNYFPLNTSGADSYSVINNYGQDCYFWFGFAGLNKTENITAEIDTYNITYKISATTSSGGELPSGYSALPTTKNALGVTTNATGRATTNNAKRFSTADDTKANGILIPAGKTMHLVGLASGTYPLRVDYVYGSQNVKNPAPGSTEPIAGLAGTASNYESSNYFPLNTSGADTLDIINNYGQDYYFWFGFAGQTLNEGILAAYDTYTLGYKID